MSTITLTFGENAENHVGMQRVNEMRNVRFNGLFHEDLVSIKAYFEQQGASAELINLDSFLERG